MREKASSLIARATTRCARQNSHQRSRISRQSSSTHILTPHLLHHPRIPTLTPPFPRARSNLSRAARSNRARVSPPPPSRLASPSARPPLTDDTSHARPLARPSSLPPPASSRASNRRRPSDRRASRVPPPSRARRTSRTPRALARVDRRATRRGTRTTVAPRAIVATVAIVVVLARVDVCARAAPTARRPRAETTHGGVCARSVVYANGMKCVRVRGKKVSRPRVGAFRA